MTLGELMGHLRCNILRDESSPYLWSDNELLRYLNEAQSIFARRTHSITDDYSDFTTFETVAGQQSYALDERIVFVAEMGVVTTNDNDELSYCDLPDRTRTQLRNSYIKGKPQLHNLQVASHKVRFYPVPDDVYTIVMMVARKPLNKLASVKDVPEINEDYHLALCDYAAAKSLANNDPEKANMAASKDFMDSWSKVIRDVKRDMARLRAGNSPKARANWTGKRAGSLF
jgi:hypothetical protein